MDAEEIRLLILKSRRELRGGPGEHLTKRAKQGDDDTDIIKVTVRGLFAECTHPYGGQCDKCEANFEVFLRILGVFRSYRGEEEFHFWGFLGYNKGHLKESLGVDPATVERQFVHGTYDPKARTGLKGWIEPCKLSFVDTFLALYNDSLVRPDVHGDRVASAPDAEEEKYEARNEEEVVKIVAGCLDRKKTTKIVFRGKRIITGTRYDIIQDEPDAKSDIVAFLDNDRIRALVRRLLYEGKSFVTTTCAIQQPTSREWTIENTPRD